MSGLRFFARGGFAIVLLFSIYYLLFSSPRVASAQSASAPIISDVTSTVYLTSAAFSWNTTDSDDDVAGASLMYGTSLDYGQSISPKSTYVISSSGAKYSFSGTINNLTAGTKYFYKISVVDTKNLMTTFTSSLTTPSPEISTPVTISRVAEAAQSESATISWETDHLSNSKVTYYKFGESKLVKVLDNLVTRHYVYLGNLTPGTEYRYIISSANVAGDVSSLEERMFKTDAAMKLPSDVGSFGLMVMSSYIGLTWKNPVAADFNRVVIMKKIGDASSFPGDGETVYSGRGQGFNDYAVRSGNDYFYTAYSYDNLGHYSAGTTRDAVFGKMSSAEVMPVATVSASQKIRLEDLRFWDNDHNVERFMVNGVVTDTPGVDFSVHLPASVLPFATAKIILSDDEQVHHFLPEMGGFRADFVFHLGTNKSYVEVDYTNGLIDVISFILEGVGVPISNFDKPIVVLQAPMPAMEVKKIEPAPAPTILQDVQKTAEAVDNFTNNEQVKQTVTHVVAPAVVGVTAISLMTVLSWVNILHVLQLILIEPFLLFTRRRRQRGGQVYNSLDKMPIALATVRLVNKDTGKVVQSKVTDERGQYSFVVNPGNYAIQVSKREFSFPSLALLGQKDDGQRVDIYHGNEIKIAESDAILAVNIPLDPVGDYHRPARLRWRRVLLRLHGTLNWGGLFVIITSLYISPVWYMWMFLLLHLSMVFVSGRFEKRTSKSKNWGRVYDPKTNLPISQAVVRLYNAKFNKMVSSQITDSRGRYYFMAGDDEYYVTAEKAGYSSNKINLADFKGKENQNVAIDIALAPV